MLANKERKLMKENTEEEMQNLEKLKEEEELKEERERQKDFDEFTRAERRIQAVTGSAALAKACQDEFDYALRLRTGEVIYFSSAEVIGSGWVNIILKPMDEQPKQNRVAYPADRGMDIRISDIVWVMDAPNGS